jgi:Mlc titration factor MtfA (ptsG expression regulator)
MEQSVGPLDNDKVEMILSAKFDYYKKLSQEDKQVFVDRVMKFMDGKDFIPRDELNITDGMDDIKTLISAASIQVTFGLEAFELPHFTKVFIYPREYYNRMTKHWHKGEANAIGALVFSWRDFKEGFADETDKINLGLHEMAHALMLTLRIDEGRDEFFVSYFDRWWAVSNDEYHKLQKHEVSFFRDYGGTDPQEFFAVCVEHFFEAAQEFKEKHPEIYKQTCILLNQDPSGDYNKITEARGPLLQTIQDTIVTPTNLAYRTKGRSMLHFVGSAIGFLFILGIFIVNIAAVQDSSGAIILCLALVVVVFLLVRYVNYREFYVYENAFGIGYERHGEDLEQIDAIGAPSTISISFKTIYRPKMPDESVIDILYLEEGEMKTKRWNYDHIKSEQVSLLKNATREYCLRNHLGFHDLDK